MEPGDEQHPITAAEAQYLLECLRKIDGARRQLSAEGADLNGIQDELQKTADDAHFVVRRVLKRALIRQTDEHDDR